MTAEVGAEPGEEGVLPDPRDELLEHRRTLGVGDAVEVHLRRGDVRDVGDDGMRGGELVLPVRPGLLRVGERHPRVPPPRRAALRIDRGPRGEALVQPQVVPPSHRHEVAEPHVSHLVEDHLSAALARGVGDLGAEQILLVEGDAADVLHRAGVELGHEQLVVLAERVGIVERLRVEVEALLGDFEDLVGLEVRRQRLAAPQAELDVAVPVAGDMVRPGRDRGDVGGHRLRRGEAPASGGAGPGPFGRRRVGSDLPPGGRFHREREPPLDIGLVEARVDAVDLVRLGVGVAVDVAVDRVGRAVQADPVALVLADGADPKLVARRQGADPDPGSVERAGRVEPRAVQEDLVDRPADELEEGRGAFFGAREPDRRFDRERVAARGEVERDLVCGVGDQPRARGSFFPGQVGRHDVG